MRLFDIFLQAGGGALLVWLTLMLVRRRLHRAYPFFFVYVIVSILATVALLALDANQRIYFFVYWGFEALSAVLVLLALHEAFHEVFYAFYFFWWFRLIFPAVVLLVSIISVTHGLRNPAPQASRLLTTIISLGTAVNYVQAGLFGVFVLLVVVLHTRWRRYPYDIVMGFVIAAAGDWISYTVRSIFGKKYPTLFSYAPPVAYICGTLVWLISFARPLQPEPKLEWTHDVTPQQLLAEMQEQIKIIKGFVDRLKNHD